MSSTITKHNNVALVLDPSETGNDRAILGFLADAQTANPGTRILAKKGADNTVILYAKNPKPSVFYQTFFSGRIARRAERAYQIVAEQLSKSDLPSAQQILTNISCAYTADKNAPKTAPLGMRATIAQTKLTTTTFSEWKIPSHPSLVQFANTDFSSPSAQLLPLPSSLQHPDKAVAAFQQFVQRGIQRRPCDQKSTPLDSERILEFARAWGSMTQHDRDALRSAWAAHAFAGGAQGAKVFAAIDHVALMICRAEGLPHAQGELFMLPDVRRTMIAAADKLATPVQLKANHPSGKHTIPSLSEGESFGKALGKAWLNSHHTLPIDFLSPARESEIKAVIRNAMDYEMRQKLHNASSEALATWSLMREEFVDAATNAALDHFCESKLNPEQNPANDGAFTFCEITNYGNKVIPGGLGDVKFGRFNDKEVAIKFLRSGSNIEGPSDQKKKAHLREFVREAMTLQRLQLQNPNAITKFIGLTREGDAVGMVFESHPNGEVNDLLKPDPARTFDVRTNTKMLNYLMHQMSVGLAQAHAAKLIHGDIKTENYLISRDGQIKLCDFGTAQPQGSGFVRHQLVQNPTLAAPETFAFSQPGSGFPTIGHTEITEKADVWSLGIAFVYLITGEYPFKGSSSEMYAAISRYASETISEAERRQSLGLEGVDSNLAALITSMLDPEPSNRPSMDEIENFFDKFQRAKPEEFLNFIGMQRAS